MNFLELLLPSEGYLCVAELLPNGFRHHFVESVVQAQEKIDELDSLGKTVFVAQASFTEAVLEAQAHNQKLPRGLSKEERKALKKDERTQSNALYLKNFFLDIDCGDDKPYKTKPEAVAALKAFCEVTKLPMPAVVVSGNGLYAHWLMEEIIPAPSWKTAARILKELTSKHEFHVDQSRTADSASVLRPVGSTHRKDPTSPKKVQLPQQAINQIPYLTFFKLLATAAKKAGVDANTLNAPKPQELNADFSEGLISGPPKSIALAADKCLQLKTFRDKLGDVSEPFWYAAIGVMVHTEDGPQYLQEWSGGHPEYSESATQSKADQYIASGSGPSTCTKFEEVNPGGCIGCPFNGRIKSPIVLGRPDPKDKELEPKDATPPEGFKIAQNGLYFDEDGRWVRFYDQDLRVVRIALDETLGYQTAVIRHCLPFDGCMEFTVRSSLVHDPKALLTYLSDNHVHVIGTKSKKAMVAYVESYISKLQRQRSMTQLMSQMGWKTIAGKPVFVLGKKIFHTDGTVDEASLAKHVPDSAKGFRTAGDPEIWSQATKLLGMQGMEPYAFSLLCAFAAPLMKFTGFDGAMVSLVGESGVGKTLMMYWAQSVFGNSKELMMLRNDTTNALIGRLGTYGNLPLTIDEVTNMDGSDLSEMVYRVTQGRDKARLTRAAEERKNINTWNTLALVSSNSSLADKLSETKHDASAEMNRLFEYLVPRRDEFSGKVTSSVFWTVQENYGHAGEKYIAWLTQNIETVKAGLLVMQDRMNIECGIKGEERYWAVIAATAIYGGLIARKLGVIQFDISPVMYWVINTVKEMRSGKLDLTDSSVNILGQFLDEHASHRLMVKGDSTGGKLCTVMEAPHGKLVIRFEPDANRIYFARSIFKAWLARKYGSYSKVRSDLINCKALKNANKNKIIGAGTSYAGASQVCWEVDTSNPSLGVVGVQLVRAATSIEKEAVHS